MDKSESNQSRLLEQDDDDDANQPSSAGAASSAAPSNLAPPQSSSESDLSISSSILNWPTWSGRMRVGKVIDDDDDLVPDPNASKAGSSSGQHHTHSEARQSHASKAGSSSGQHPTHSEARQSYAPDGNFRTAFPEGDQTNVKPPADCACEAPPYPSPSMTSLGPTFRSNRGSEKVCSSGSSSVVQKTDASGTASPSRPAAQGEASAKTKLSRGQRRKLKNRSSLIDRAKTRLAAEGEQMPHSSGQGEERFLTGTVQHTSNQIHPKVPGAIQSHWNGWAFSVDARMHSVSATPQNHVTALAGDWLARPPGVHSMPPGSNQLYDAGARRFRAEEAFYDTDGFCVECGQPCGLGWKFCRFCGCRQPPIATPSR